jgi:hypothetical protein
MRMVLSLLLRLRVNIALAQSWQNWTWTGSEINTIMM